MSPGLLIATPQLEQGSWLTLVAAVARALQLGLVRLGRGDPMGGWVSD